MNTLKWSFTNLLKPLNLAFLPLFLMCVVSSLPFINPYNPRLNSDLIAFFGLS